ncbi:hypothetical protein J416_10906 [Gracilibacillus halophilus YIM-C55.5]|uniref:DUF4305 domain-containing protein n=1 Tax=Gracilibacillus halophilus YIM-C55.5 TaxID=1308866 RepID=N4WTB4_9BACI|nr:YdiK family protein [Gracilibacillus halophilus]ENH96406.1 hypothetical protein J416_10906 [Gracilibacillus halophilus YIM-C55.5]
MRFSPLPSAILYFGLGVLFTYIGIQAAEDTIFNFITMALAIFATMDFIVSIRLFNLHLRIKRANQDKK